MACIPTGLMKTEVESPWCHTFSAFPRFDK
jgi:hypothetical protein